MAEVNNNKLTADEIALYDRQIRLWGMQTQLRIRSTKVLIINLGGVATEIVKNLVLGGIDLLEILDSSTVKEEDLSCQFFLTDDSVGKPKLPFALPHIKELNNRVTLTIDLDTLQSKTIDYFKKFDLVIGTELTKDEIITVNSLTRELNIPFYATGLHGLFGYIFSDLIEHHSEIEKPVGNVATQVGPINKVKTVTEVSRKINDGSPVEIVKIRDTYKAFKDILISTELVNQLNKRQLKKLTPALPLVFSLFDIPKLRSAEDTVPVENLKSIAIEKCLAYGIPETVLTPKYIEAFSQQAFAEFAPIAAILGGSLAQDVINFLGRKQSPFNNFLVIDGFNSDMPIFAL